MLREDGIVMDDGTTTRISENHYHMTTTTAQAANVLSHLEYYLQLVWPELNVNVVSTTEQWAGAGDCWTKIKRFTTKTISKFRCFK
jgi:sarcosine oxidase subunit alpha